MRPIYVPIFDRFFESSIMQEELTVRFVMLALIRLAWRSGANGEVDIDLRMFALSINVPLPDVEAAINRLMEPDPTSHSPDEDGRRLIPIDPDRPMRGWRLVNWQKYRVLVNRLNDAARKRDEYHENKDTSKISESLQKSPRVSKNRENLVTRRDDTRRDETKKGKRESAFVAPTVEEVTAYAKEKGLSLDAVYFVDFFEAKGWITGKTKMHDWHASARNAARDGWTFRHGNTRIVVHKNQGDLDREREGDEIARNRAAAARQREERERNDDPFYGMTDEDIAAARQKLEKK